MVATAPDRPHGVDDDPRGQPEPWRRLCLAGLAPTEQSAGVHQLGPSRSMCRTVDAAAAKQRGIGGVDNGVHGKGGDVGANDGQARGHDLAFGENAGYAMTRADEPVRLGTSG